MTTRQAAFAHRGFSVGEPVQLGKGRGVHKLVSIQELLDGSIRALLRGPDGRRRWVRFLRVNKLPVGP